MRFLNGIVLGFILAIGVAYWHDRSIATDPDGDARRIVNWDEFGRTMSDAGNWVQAQISQIGQSLHRRG